MSIKMRHILSSDLPLIRIPVSALELYCYNDDFAYLYWIHGEHHIPDSDEWVMKPDVANPAIMNFEFISKKSPIIRSSSSKTGYMWAYPSVGKTPKEGQVPHPWDVLNKHAKILNQIPAVGTDPKLVSAHDMKEWETLPNDAMPVAPHPAELYKCGIRSASKANPMCTHKTYIPSKWLHDPSRSIPPCCGNTPVVARTKCPSCHVAFFKSASAQSPFCVKCHGRGGRPRK